MGDQPHKWRRRILAGVAGLTVAGGSFAALSHDEPFHVPEGQPNLAPPSKVHKSFAQQVRQERAKVIAHRGASDLYPENTLQAFEAAIALGADAIELDVRLTKDGVPVVMHDDSVNRTTDGEGKVEDMTYAQISQLDAGNGEKVPTLQEVVDLVAGRATIYMEAKTFIMPAQGWSEMIEDGVANKGFDYDQLVLMGGGYTTYYGIREQFPNIHVAPSFDNDNEPILETAKYMGANEVNLKYSEISPELVESLHKEGIRINAWTVNDDDDMLKVLSKNVDGVITDRTSMAKKLVALHNSVSQSLDR